MCEAFVHDIIIGIAAHGDRSVDAILGGVGKRCAFFAEVLFATFTRGALATGVNNDAYCGDVAHFELGHLAAGRRHAAEYLVAGHERIDRLAPLVARHVQIAMANAAEENVDEDFSGAGFATREGDRCKRRLSVRGSEAFG